MRQFTMIAAAIALAAGPALAPALAQAAESQPDTLAGAAQPVAGDSLSAGIGVSETLEDVPGTSIPAVLAGVGGAAVFFGLALGLGSDDTTSTTGTN